MKLKTALTLNLGFLLVSGVITKVTQYLIDIIIARTFGVTVFGVYSEYFTVLSLLILLADFGLNSFIIAKYHTLKTENKFSLKNFILFKLLITFITLVIILAVGLFKFGSESSVAIYYLLTAIFFLTTINNFIFFYFRAILKPVYEAFTRIITFILFLGALILLRSFLSSVNTVLLFFIVINAMVLVFNSVILIFKKEEESSETKRDLRAFFVSILPYGLSIVFVELYYYFDSLLLGLNFPPEILGNYRAAYGIITMFSFLLTLVHHTLIPMYSRKKIDLSLNKLVQLLLFVASFGIVSIVFVFADQIIALLYGKGFESSVSALRILILTVPLMWNYALYAIRLIAHGHQKELTKITFTACLMNIILNLIFSFRFSLYSAAIITIITEAIIFLMTYFLYKRKEAELNSSLISE